MRNTAMFRARIATRAMAKLTSLSAAARGQAAGRSTSLELRAGCPQLDDWPIHMPRRAWGSDGGPRRQPGARPPATPDAATDL
jgi:hypothetical protein